MMASKETENIKPTITKHSSEFQKDVYASTPIGELVLFALAVLQAEASPVPAEEIVSTCFRLFPNSFALKNYFYWPDSALVARQLQNAKERGALKGSPSEGYELKSSGKQSAKQTAKALNVSLPVPSKPVTPVMEPVKEAVPVKIEEKTPAKAVQKPAKKKQPVKEAAKQSKPKVQKESLKATAPVKAKPTQKPKTEEKKKISQPAVKAKPAPKAKPVEKAKAAPAQKTKPAVKPAERVKAKPAPKTKPVAKAKPAPKAKPVSKPVETKKAKLAPKIKPKSKPQEKPAPKAKVQKVKAEAPKQLSMELAPPPVKEKVKGPTAQPKTKKEPPPPVVKKPVKAEAPALVAVSKEEKVKAAKVIKQLEHSDAYQLYRRNGKRAQIGEFDFRNMLFATMESSAETLKRNLDLFKRYAEIHFRTDLVAFLEFCEENFSALLAVKVKGKK